MGRTGGLVRSVFSRNRSVGSHDTNARSHGVDKKRWSSVRSYLCGDEFNSVLAEEDSASIRSSEATVTQPVGEDLEDEEEVEREENEEKKAVGKQNSTNVLSIEENAAIVIQSAFRQFRARRHDLWVEQIGERESVKGHESPDQSSIGTSIEVQTAGSLEKLMVEEDKVAQQRTHQKSRTQVLKLKEDWDDSTVSSNVSKLRIQNRLEASTRRERALAYAFSQQLRVCSKKKQSHHSDKWEPNMGWSWLERWMATRQQETSLVEDQMNKQFEPVSRDGKAVIIKKDFDVTAEEKESCGSNEVPAGIGYLAISQQDPKYDSNPVKNRLTTKRTVSRRKTVPSNQYPTQFTKVSKKDCSRGAEKDKKHKQMRASYSVGETKQKDSLSQSLMCSTSLQ